MAVRVVMAGSDSKKFSLLASLMLTKGFAMKIKAVCAILAPVLAVGAPFFVPKLVQLRSAMIQPSHPMGVMASLALGTKKSAPAPAPEKVPAAADPSAAGEPIVLQVGAEQGVLK